MKSSPAASFYRSVDGSEKGSEGGPGGGSERVSSTAATAGPWSPKAQHGGPPSGLLTRALEALLAPGQVLGRISVDLLGPVPVGPLAVSSTVLRPGRSVALLQATLTDEESGRDVAVGRGWALPRSSSGPGSLTPPTHGPGDGVLSALPGSWSRGYVDAVEWRWITGQVLEAGPATLWMRPLVPLLPDEPLSPLQRLMTCVDSASGASTALDPAAWTFMNTEITVHVLREPVGEWVLVDAETTLSPTAAGLATSSVYDELGLVARSAQALLVVPRTPAG